MVPITIKLSDLGPRRDQKGAQALRFTCLVFMCVCVCVCVQERVKKIGEMIERDGSSSSSQTPNNTVLQFKSRRYSHSLSTASVSSSLTSLS